MANLKVLRLRISKGVYMPSGCLLWGEPRGPWAALASAIAPQLGSVLWFASPLCPGTSTPPER